MHYCDLCVHGARPSRRLASRVADGPGLCARAAVGRKEPGRHGCPGRSGTQGARAGQAHPTSSRPWSTLRGLHTPPGQADTLGGCGWRFVSSRANAAAQPASWLYVARRAGSPVHGGDPGTSGTAGARARDTLTAPRTAQKPWSLPVATLQTCRLVVRAPGSLPGPGGYRRLRAWCWRTLGGKDVSRRY